MHRHFFVFVKVLSALVVAYYSGASHLPLIVAICFGWYAWLWFIGSGYKWRLLITLGFAMVALGWWTYLRESYFLGQMGGRRIGNQEDPLLKMAHLSFWEGVGLILAGIAILAFADYMKLNRPKLPSTFVKETMSDQDNTWPPAPNKPQ